MPGIGFGIMYVAPKLNAFNGELSLKITVLALLFQHLQITKMTYGKQFSSVVGSPAACNLIINFKYTFVVEGMC